MPGIPDDRRLSPISLPDYAEIDPAYNVTMSEPSIHRINLPSVEAFREQLSPLVLAHLEWLEEESRRHNLTRVPREDWLVRHVMDSLAPALGGWEIGDTFVDIGTGPGFPGMPLGLQNERALFALIESKKKVANILQDFLIQNEIHPRGVALGERIEDLARDPNHREKHDRVVTRALSALPVLVELGMPYLKKKGELWCWKSSISELNDVGKALQELNGCVSRVLEYQLPGEDAPRFIIALQKMGETPEKYPRRVGIPQKKPLI